jgi:hypothetical protein
MESLERQKLRQTKDEKLAAIRTKIAKGEELTLRETTLLAEFVRRDEQETIERTLRNVPVEVWENAVERNRVAPTQHKADAFFRKIGLPIPIGKKSGTKTFDLYKFFDWFLGEFLPGRIVGMESNDDIIKLSSLITNPNLREQSQHKYIVAQTEKVNVQTVTLRRELVPVEEFATIMQSVGERLNRFGEKLKAKEHHELLDEYNEIIAGSARQFEKSANKITETMTNKPEKRRRKK